MARYRDIDPAVLKFWDESKVVRNNIGQFWFKGGKKKRGFKKDRNPKVSPERSQEVSDIDSELSRLGVISQLIQGKETVIPEAARDGFTAANNARIKLPEFLEVVAGGPLSGLIFDRKGKRVPAAYDPRLSKVILNKNSDTWHNPMHVAVQNGMGFWASQDYKDMVLHEIGHHGHNMNYDNWLDYLEVVRKPVPPSILDTVGDKISIYGTTKVGEFVAETFTHMMQGKMPPMELMEAYDYYKGPYPQV